MAKDEMHLDVYIDRSELYFDSKKTIFYEGKQSHDAERRYSKIYKELGGGFYAKTMDNISLVLTQNTLVYKHKLLLKALVDGLTSEVGRAIVGLACLQLTIKSIEPAQCIRLHKGGRSDSRFSWKEGLSMRTLDNSFNTPFLREYGLLNMNKDGIMMTRSLAENYPYSRLYKAEMRGPIRQWIELVEAIEDSDLSPYPALCFLLSLLKNRSDAFSDKAIKTIEMAKNLDKCSFEQIKNILIKFFSQTTYSARAFEVVIHGFMQSLSEMRLTNGTLIPLSQMRSANKKHGNVGDIELKYGNMIIEAWDAKYGKPYLRDELEELNDKLNYHQHVEVAGFIANLDIDRTSDIILRAEELSIKHNCEIKLLSFDEWIKLKINTLSEEQLNTIGYRWIIAVSESFGQKRTNIAPIDEPCDSWLDDLSNIIESV